MTKTARPTRVFIHGAGSNRDFWHEQQAVFPDAHFPDLPGHAGREMGSGGQGTRDKGQGTGFGPGSDVDGGNSTASIEAYADWVALYIEHEGLDNVVLNGHSMGGAVALTLALQRPAWLRGLVLTATGARLPVSPRLLDLLRTDYPAAVDMIVELSFARPSAPLTYAQRARISGVRRQLLRTPQHVTLADYDACDHFDVSARLGEISVPTLILAGAQDRMTPPDYSRFLDKSIKGSRLRIFEAAGHMLPLEQSREYNQELKIAD